MICEVSKDRIKEIIEIKRTQATDHAVKVGCACSRSDGHLEPESCFNDISQTVRRGIRSNSQEERHEKSIT